MFPSHVAYCSKNGLSRPLSLRNCSLACCVAVGITASATSPGNRRSRLNVNSVARMTTTTSWTSRRAIVRMASVYFVR